MTARHQWAEPVRWDAHVTYRGCMRPGCGLCKISRHEGPTHWCEFERPDGARVVMSDGSVPPCEAGAV